ncbi:MAG: YfhO family protein [Patescibacteria group bacterium]
MTLKRAALEPGQANVATFREQEVEIKTQSGETAILVVTDTDYPGWKATIDGKPSKIYRANYALRSVVVPAGSHTVRFSYAPFSLKLGIAISLASAVLTLILVLAKYPQPDSNRRFTG